MPPPRTPPSCDHSFLKLLLRHCKDTPTRTTALCFEEELCGESLFISNISHAVLLDHSSSCNNAFVFSSSPAAFHSLLIAQTAVTLFFWIIVISRLTVSNGTLPSKRFHSCRQDTFFASSLSVGLLAIPPSSWLEWHDKYWTDQHETFVQRSTTRRD